MSEERMALNQQERDWRQWLHQAQRKQITQREAARRVQVSETRVTQALATMSKLEERLVGCWTLRSR
jgi:hypothetical protein